MRGHKVVWILLLLLAGGAAWAVRLLRDDVEWTKLETAPVPEPEPAPARAFAAPEPAAPVAAEPVAAEPVAAEPGAPEAAAPAPAALSDALTRLEGVGPKIGAALAAAGLTTFAALAEASEDELRAALSAAGLRFAPSLPTWSRQARLLADGDEAGFAELTARLTAGRE